MPSGCARARWACSTRWSQGKSGSRPDTERADHQGAVVGTVLSFTLMLRSLLVLRRQGGDHRVVLVDHAHLGRASRRAEVVEEVDVGVVVVLPLLRGVVLVEDGL